MKSKKALGTLQAIVITLVVIGVVLGIGLLVLEEFEDSTILGDNTETVFNESISPTDAGVYVVFNSTSSDLFCYNSFAVLRARNGTQQLIGTSNYSYDSATGRVWNLTGEYTDHDWNVTYTYQHDTSGACESVSETITAIGTIPTWLTIVVILLIVGILLAIVFKIMPRAGESGFGGGSSGGGGTSPVIAEI